METMEIAARARNWVAKQVPGLFWKGYSRKARALGLDRLYLALSFDCDTREDIEAAAEMDEWLRNRGIRAIYAVPGEQLELGASVYRKLAEQGAEFLNHGGLPHTIWKNGRYHSATFYDRMTDQEVVADIRRGHEIVARIIGKIPVGFRAPHFGCFQSSAQLGLQYSTLKSLGYRYSTSTLPATVLRRGPVYDLNGLFEIPLTGSFRFPFVLLDSWTYLKSPIDRSIKPEYADMFVGTVKGFMEMGIPGVMNVYVDPSHVNGSQYFREAIERSLEMGIKPITYMELLDQTSNHFRK
jgi:hypothetical protein